MPGGILNKLEKHVGKDEKLVPGEWMYPKIDGFPNFESNDQRKYLLYMHGGAFVFGSSATHRLLLFDIISKSHVTVLAVNYTRAPEAKYPVAELECLEVYKWLLHRVDASQIIFGGDSAGGAIATGVLIRCRNEGIPLPAGAVLLSPWVDIFDIERNSIKLYNGVDYLPVKAIRPVAQLYVDPPTDSASAIFQRLVGLPPLLIEVGEYEILRDQIYEFAEKAMKEGVNVELNTYPHMTHVFQIFSHRLTNMKQPLDSMNAIAKFINRVTAKPQFQEGSMAEIEISPIDHRSVEESSATPTQPQLSIDIVS